MLPSFQNLTRDANALKNEGRIGEAISFYQDAVRQFPASAVALHNLASAYGDAGNHVDAERVAAIAMQAGLNGAETWLVRARARFGKSDFAGAETAYRSAMERQPENGCGADGTGAAGLDANGRAGRDLVDLRSAGWGKRAGRIVVPVMHVARH